MASSNYFLPAILLNPVVVLHSINTYVSYAYPSNVALSPSPHAYLSALGPDPSTQPYLDMHDRGNLRWTYTLIMVCAQLLAYLNFGTNREKKKAKARRQGSPSGQGRRSDAEEKETSWDRTREMMVNEKKDLGIQSPVHPEMKARKKTEVLTDTDANSTISSSLPDNRRVTHSMRRIVSENQKNKVTENAKHGLIMKPQDVFLKHEGAEEVEEYEIGLEAGDISDEERDDRRSDESSTSETSEEEVAMIL